MIGGSLTCRICHAGPGVPCQPGAHFEAANAHLLEEAHDLHDTLDQLGSTE